MTICPGCGLTGGPEEGAIHPYMTSSPRCWTLYGELLATGPAGQLAVDSYAVQHPGRPERRAIQSVAVHLVSLCAAFERDWPVDLATDLIRHAVDNDPGWRWLAPEPPIGTIAVADVVAVEWVERTPLITRWATDVWEAYADHHDQVRTWLDTVLDGFRN